MYDYFTLFYGRCKKAAYAPIPVQGYVMIVVEPSCSHVVPCAKHFQHVCRIMLLCVCCTGCINVCFYQNCEHPSLTILFTPIPFSWDQDRAELTNLTSPTSASFLFIRSLVRILSWRNLFCGSTFFSLTPGN